MDNTLPRRVAARDGLVWVTGAFKLFFKSPLIFSAGAAIFIGALLILQAIPQVGAGLSELITPLLAAGFMRAFRAIDENEAPKLPHLLAGFQTHALPLAMVGAIYLGILLAVMALMKSLGVDYQALMNAMQQGATLEQMAVQLQGKDLPILLGSALILPAVAATWFAPALILFGNAAPLQAMGLSLKASFKNWPAMLLNGLAMIPVLLLVVVPIIGLMVMLPVAMGTAYLGYQSMFATKNSGGA